MKYLVNYKSIICLFLLFKPHFLVAQNVQKYEQKIILNSDKHCDYVTFWVKNLTDTIMEVDAFYSKSNYLTVQSDKGVIMKPIALGCERRYYKLKPNEDKLIGNFIIETLVYDTMDGIIDSSVNGKYKITWIFNDIEFDPIVIEYKSKFKYFRD